MPRRSIQSAGTWYGARSSCVFGFSTNPDTRPSSDMLISPNAGVSSSRTGMAAIVTSALLSWWVRIMSW